MEIAPRDLFSANQIIHLRPLMGEGVFARFVKANNFVRDFYPNFELGTSRKSQAARRKPLVERVLSLGAAQLAERVSRALYGWHLQRKAATWQSLDQVRLEDECLKLHTSSHRASTIRKFDATMTAVLARQPVTVARR